ncbi:unnamed protein product [Victoria cruziana]
MGKMQLHFLPGHRRVTISTRDCLPEIVKEQGGGSGKTPNHRRLSCRSVLPTALLLMIIMPFLFFRTAFLALDGATRCPSLDCIGRTLSQRFQWIGGDSPRALAAELTWAILKAENELNENQKNEDVPESLDQLIADLKTKTHNVDMFVLKTKLLLSKMEQKVREAKLQGYIYRHYASIGVPMSLHCLSLKLADEYSSNAAARTQIPSPDSVTCLTNNLYQHYVLLTDNVLAAGIVIASAVKSSSKPENAVFHIITDKKTYAPMHAWFALNPVYSPAVLEVKGLHQLDWPSESNIKVVEITEMHGAVKEYFYNRWHGSNLSHVSSDFGREMETARRSPNYVSFMNHMRIYLPELFPKLHKVVFLDDDIVVQHDLSHLWEIDLQGMVNGAVETSKKFEVYLNFSNPFVSKRFQRDRLAWAYGMNIFDLQAWRKTDITERYHYWLKLNLDSGSTLWRLGTLPPALLAFDGYVHIIDSKWHVSGLGYRPDVDRQTLEEAAVLHFSGPAKPWLQIGFPELRSLWSRHLNFSNEFIRSCGFME